MDWLHDYVFSLFNVISCEAPNGVKREALTWNSPLAPWQAVLRHGEQGHPSKLKEILFAA